MDLGSLLAGFSGGPTAPQPAQTAPIMPDQPPGPENQPAPLKDQWDSFLQNPATRAALLSFGLNALSGGWGTGSQQLAQAAGAGLEAGGQVGANIDKQATDEQKRQDRLAQNATENDLKRQEITSREKVANIVANSRVDAANIRSTNGPKNMLEQKAFTSAYNQTAAKLHDSQIITQMSEDEILAAAQNAGNRALEAYRAQFGGNGGNLSGAGAPSGASPVGTPGGGNTPENTQTNSAAPVDQPIVKINPTTGQKAIYNRATRKWEIQP